MSFLRSAEKAQENSGLIRIDLPDDGATNDSRRMGKAKKERRDREPFRWPMPVARFFFGMSYRRKFYQRLRIISVASVPLKEGVEELRKQAMESGQTAFMQMLDDVYQKMVRGALFSDAIADWCPSVDRLLLASSTGGNRSMTTVVDQILHLQDGVAEMKGSLLSVLTEPTMILLGTYGLILWMSSSFMTKLLAAAPGVTPAMFTGPAQQMVAVGRFASGVGAFALPMGILAFFLLIRWSMPNWKGRVRTWFDNIPPWSVYRSIQGASWMQSFAAMAQSGITYEDILQETSNRASPWLRERLLAARERLMSGSSLGEAFWATGYQFPSKGIAADLKAFGSRTGFDQALGSLADEWFSGTVKSVKGASFFVGLFSMLASTLAILWVFTSSNAMINQLTQIMRNLHGGG